jgi:hypothetical protein
LFAIWAELDRAASSSGWSTTLNPHVREVVLHQMSSSAGVPVARALMTAGTWARILAVASLTAFPEPPTHPEQIAPTQNWRRNGFLDRRDVEEIRERLVTALFRSRVGEDGQLLFHHFLRAVHGHEGDAFGPPEDVPGLLARLGEALGLTLSPRPGGGSRVPDGVLAKLVEEGASMVEAVREYSPDEDELEAVERLVAAEDSMPAHRRALLRERRRRGATRNARSRPLALLLRYPFLLPSDVRYIDRGRKAESTARRLIVARLAWKMDDRSLRRRLEERQPAE